MVAFDAETNDQLGWTLMCGPDAILKDMFAFMPITGDVAFAGGDEKVGGLGANRDNHGSFWGQPGTILDHFGGDLGQPIPRCVSTIGTVAQQQ